MTMAVRMGGLVGSLLAVLAGGCSGSAATKPGGGGGAAGTAAGGTAGTDPMGAPGGAGGAAAGTAGTTPIGALGGAGGIPAVGGAAGTNPVGALGGASGIAGTAGTAGTNPMGALGGAGGTPASGGAGGAGGTPGAAGTTGSGAGSTCSQPQLLTLTDGKVAVAGDTHAGSTELATLDCAIRGTAGPLVGRTLYYRFPARAGLKYELRLDSHSYDPDVLYVFPAATSCSVDAIQAACRSDGAAVASIVARAFIFRPSTSGDYVVAVDADGFSGSSLPGGPFTLSVYEYCDTLSAGCATQACRASMPACDGNVATQCNDSGTGTTGSRTDCTSTGATCQGGACRATIADQPGWSGTKDFPSSALTSSTAGTAVNFYTVAQSRTLVQIAQEMKVPAATPLTFVVYEAATAGGTYRNIFSKTIAAAGVDAESSGAISVLLVAGRSYAIGLGWSAAVQYRVSTTNSGSALPQATFFGQLTSAKLFESAPEATAVSYQPPAMLAFPQVLTTTL